MDIAACALGATWNERHFTKDRTWKGTDHAASLEPAGLSKLCRDLKAAWRCMSYKKTDILPLEAAQRRQAQVGLLQPGPRQEDRRLDSPYSPCANVSLELSFRTKAPNKVKVTRVAPRGRIAPKDRGAQEMRVRPAAARNTASRGAQ